MPQKIENTDKINIYMSERMKRELTQDAERFEAFFDKDRNPVMNRFLSTLIANYYESYRDGRNTLAASIRAMLIPPLNHQQANQIAEVLTGKLHDRNKSYEDNAEPVRVSLKPTRETDWIISDLRLNNPPEFKLSTYFRQLFSSYLSLPMYHRERIIFKKTADILLEACRQNTPLRFTSANAPGIVFHVIPYELVHGTDEMFNYLLCQKYDESMNQYLASSFRLCRLGHPSEEYSSAVLQKDVISHLKKMKRCGPQYVINDDMEEVCIQLTPAGQDSYRIQYLGRPKYTRIQPLENGNCNYYFENAEAQLYFYFRRFSAKEAIVLSPESLKSRIKAFHEESWKAYQ